MNKPKLRQTFRQRLSNVEDAHRKQAARQVADHVLALPEVAHTRGILICLSFGVELDTWALVARLEEAGVSLFVPRIERQRRLMHVYPYPCPLETLSYGLRQPVVTAPCLPSEAIASMIDLVLVLGLAFDRSGYRLGHGGGYFDRFLAHHTLPAVGLGHDFQIVDALPREHHDIPMDILVTEEGVCRIDLPETNR